MRRSILVDQWFLSDYHSTTPPAHDINALAEIIHNGVLTTMGSYLLPRAINGRPSERVICGIFSETDRRDTPTTYLYKVGPAEIHTIKILSIDMLYLCVSSDIDKFCIFFTNESSVQYRKGYYGLVTNR